MEVRRVRKIKSGIPCRNYLKFIFKSETVEILGSSYLIVQVPSHLSLFKCLQVCTDSNLHIYLCKCMDHDFFMCFTVKVIKRLLTGKLWCKVIILEILMIVEEKFENPE